MRPSTIGAFSAGLSFGIVAVVAAMTFATSGAEQLPACETSIEYVTAVVR